MTDYAKLTVPNLKGLLTERELPTTGKKDELIARLQEADAKSGPRKGKDGSMDNLAPPDEEIDWDDASDSKDARAPTPKDESKGVAASTSAKKDSNFQFKRVSDAFQGDESKKGVEKTQSVKDAEAKARKRRQERFGLVDIEPRGEKKDATTLKERTLKTAPPQVGSAEKAAGGGRGGSSKRVLDDATEAEKAKKRAERFKV